MFIINSKFIKKYSSKLGIVHTCMDMLLKTPQRGPALAAQTSADNSDTFRTPASVDLWWCSQCCQPSVKITETSVFSVVESGGFVIRNLSVK